MRDLYDDLMDRFDRRDPWEATRPDISDDDFQDEDAEWENLANILDEEDADDFPVEFEDN